MHLAGRESGRYGAALTGVWTFAGSLIWNAILAGAGVFLGSRFRELEKFVGPVAIAITVLIVIGYVWRIVTWKPRDQR